jgi:hypothetical protein
VAETTAPARKTAINWITQTIRRMAWKRALGRLETKLPNCEVTLKTIWLTAKYIAKSGRPNAPSAVCDDVRSIHSNTSSVTPTN